MTVSERIRQLRVKKRITQKEVADHVGVEQSYYSKLERIAGNRIYFDVLVKICEALEVSLYELLEEDIIPNKKVKAYLEEGAKYWIEIGREQGRSEKEAEIKSVLGIK